MVYQNNFVDEKDFRALARDSKLLSLYLMSSSKVSLCGVVEPDDSLIMFVLGMTSTEYAKSLKELQEVGIIAIDNKTKEIVFTKFLTGENPLVWSKRKSVKFKADQQLIKSKTIKAEVDRIYNMMRDLGKMAEVAGNKSRSPLQNLNS